MHVIISQYNKTVNMNTLKKMVITVTNYPDFIDSTGYGEVDGILGVNCRHSYSPFFPEFQQPRYSAEDLREIESKTYTVDGKTIDAYEASRLCQLVS